MRSIQDVDSNYVSEVAWLLLRLWKDLKMIEDREDFQREQQRTCSWLRAFNVMNTAMCSSVVSFGTHRKVQGAIDRTIKRIENLQYRGVKTLDSA